MPISLLRVAGLLLALGLILVASSRLRRARTGSRVPSTGLLLVAIGLGAVSIAPDLVRPLRDVLGLEGEPLGRLVTVLVISVAWWLDHRETATSLDVLPSLLSEGKR